MGRNRVERGLNQPFMKQSLIYQSMEVKLVWVNSLTGHVPEENLLLCSDLELELQPREADFVQYYLVICFAHGHFKFPPKKTNDVVSCGQWILEKSRSTCVFTPIEIWKMPCLP